MADFDTIIVGGGLAGLACARELHERGQSIVVLERAERPGGRLLTDVVDGFRLDRGFQVFLPSYPEAQRVLDYEALELASFKPGAVVRSKGRFHKISDPRRAFGDSLGAILGGVGTFGDKLKTLRFARHLEREVESGRQSTAMEAIERVGFSAEFRDTFLRPFLGGVFLDRKLGSPAHFLRFVWSMFQAGLASLPKLGMEAIPAQLAERLPTGTIRTNATVASLEGNTVVLESGERLTANDVVVATDGETAAELAGTKPVTWSGVHHLTYAADAAPYEGPWLLLNGGAGQVNDVAVLSEVQPSYAPEGKALISVSVLDHGDASGVELDAQVRKELVEWFGGSVEGWRHLRTLAIPRSLPRVQARREPADRSPSGAWIAGDHTESPSIHGALLSGRRVAEEIVAVAK